MAGGGETAEVGTTAGASEDAGGGATTVVGLGASVLPPFEGL